MDARYKSKGEKPNYFHTKDQSEIELGTPDPVCWAAGRRPMILDHSWASVESGLSAGKRILQSTWILPIALDKVRVNLVEIRVDKMGGRWPAGERPEGRKDDENIE